MSHTSNTEWFVTLGKCRQDPDIDGCVRIVIIVCGVKDEWRCGLIGVKCLSIVSFRYEYVSDGECEIRIKHCRYFFILLVI